MDKCRNDKCYKTQKENKNEYDNCVSDDDVCVDIFVKDSRAPTLISNVTVFEEALLKDSGRANNSKILSDEQIGLFYKSQCDKYKYARTGVTIYDISRNGKFYYLNLRAGTCDIMDKPHLVRRLEGLKECERVKFIKHQGVIFIVQIDKDKNYKSQAGIFDSIKGSISFLYNAAATIQDTYKGIKSTEFKWLLIDTLALIVEVRDGYLTFSKVLSVLLRLYTSHHRYVKIFKAQALGPFADLVAGYAALGLPSHLLDAMKTVTLLTGKKTLDSEFLADVAMKTLSLLDGVFTFMGGLAESVLPVGVYGVLATIFKYFTNSLCNYRLIRKVTEVNTEFLKCEQAIFDPAFRERVTKLRDECKKSPNFMEYVTNNSNKFFLNVWNSFESNIYKGVKNFDESRRVEPLCFVLEGLAGSGKSAFMNNVVDLLRESGLSIYTHNVPAAEDGKDFYDDYENQDVFVMDDIGQQGKSQWRYIINFVSPIKYPLPCATATKKNTKFFTSKVILCTTNHFRDLENFTSSDCISDPEALKRRCHVIDVRNVSVDGVFDQLFTYYKFAHKDNEKIWYNKFLYHNAKINVPSVFSTVGLQGDQKLTASLTWFYSMFKQIRQNEIRESEISTVPKNVLRDIIDQADDEFYDARTFDSQSLVDNVFVTGMRHLRQGKQIASEWFSGNVSFVNMLLKNLIGSFNGFVMSGIENMFSLFSLFNDQMPDSLKKVFSYFSDIKVDIYSLLIIFVTVCGIKYLFYNNNDDAEDDMLWMSELEKCMTAARERVREQEKAAGVFETFTRQSDRIENVKKFVKLVEIIADHEPSEEAEHYTVLTHGVVSGRRLLLPSHVDITETCGVNIYATSEHYRHKHREMENVKLNVIKVFPTVDLMVCEIKGVIPLYKRCRNLFLNDKVEVLNLELINSFGVIPVKTFVSIRPNTEEVRYDGLVYKNDKQGKLMVVGGKVVHPPGSGVYSPLTGDTMCGTVLASNTAGIVAFHVAGNDDMGFMVTPLGIIRQQIRELMLATPECDFEVDDKIIDDFSGVRLRYDKDQVQCNYVNSDSNLVPTALHTSFNSNMDELINELSDSKHDLYIKRPPNFRALGTPLKTMEAMSKKSFQHQGLVRECELEYIKACVDTLLVDFSDLTDEETAFGCEGVVPLNKDSSNGYGWDKSKLTYFDFDKREITPDGRKMIDGFEHDALADEFNLRNFLTREALKDELRKEAKVNEPRTFRVMPVPHIFWTKKICGHLVKHFKDNRYETGCCVGLNPYKDFSVIYRQLKQCVITGDIDFSKWDGSVVSLIMEAIGECLLRRYKGVHRKVFEYVLLTMTRSFTLAGDSLWATTHGLPSGTWLTLLMNCLLNRSLTALTIYRNKENANVEDFRKVVDFVVGDDKIFGVVKGMEHVVNLQTIAKVASSLGMACTNGDKTPITSISQPLENLSFVKRIFKFHPNLGIVGALDLSTLINTLQWYDKTRDYDVVMEGKLRAVQVEAYLHGFGVYHAFMRFLRKSDYSLCLFSDDRVLEILKDEEMYSDVMLWLGKDKSFVNM